MSDIKNTFTRQKVHFLKTWTVYFDDVEKGTKTWELRLNDRNFKVGDHLVLMRYSDKNSRFTGRMLQFEVTHIFHGNTFGVVDGWCIMSIKPVPKTTRQIELMIKKYNDSQKNINLNF